MTQPRFHVRLTATFDRYIEAPDEHEAERLAEERMRTSFEQYGFSPTFHPVYPSHATRDCRDVDAGLEEIETTLEH